MSDKELEQILLSKGGVLTPFGWEFNNLDISNLGLANIPKISKVADLLNCSNNKLTSLDWAPKECNRFVCFGNNNLTSIKGIIKYKTYVIQYKSKKFKHVIGKLVEYKNEFGFVKDYTTTTTKYDSSHKTMNTIFDITLLNGKRILIEEGWLKLYMIL